MTDVTRSVTAQIPTRWLLTATCGMLCLCAWAEAGWAGQNEDEARAAKIKAAFLLNFVRFTHWPEDAFNSQDAPIIVTVLGRDPMGDVLDRTMASRKVHHRTILVRRLRTPQPDDFSQTSEYQKALDNFHQQLRQSHMLFFAAHNAPHARDILKQLSGLPLLTVGDGRDFEPLPVMLSLYEDDKRISFSANLKLIERSSIKVSSQLLGLARIVDSH